jgi:DNA-binding transcriptional LysR family regulator
MHDLNDLYYFVAVVDHGGFAAAGRALGLQKSRLTAAASCRWRSGWACAC